MLGNQPNLGDELGAAVQHRRRGAGMALEELAALQTVLDREIDRLPAKHKTAVILRYLEGRTIDETAVTLGWGRRRVCTRLRQGRRTLLRRLRQQGLTLSGSSLRCLMQAEARHGMLAAAKRREVIRPAKAGAADEEMGLSGSPCRVVELVRAGLAELARCVTG